MEAVQLLTVDGLTLSDGVHSCNDDRLSALTALLCSGAEQLAACLSPNASPKGTVVCVDNTAYAAIRVNNDLTLGIKMQEQAMYSHLLSKVHAVIAANPSYFSV